MANWLCAHFNKGGWLFSNSVTFPAAMWVHRRTCPDMKDLK